jgi:hypothetical protein
MHTGRPEFSQPIAHSKAFLFSGRGEPLVYNPFICRPSLSHDSSYLGSGEMWVPDAEFEATKSGIAGLLTAANRLTFSS